MSAREVLQIVELRQPRCVQRFGALPCRAALATGQRRTNDALWSQDLDNAYWTKSGATITANANTAPDGTVTADRIVEDTSTGGHAVQRSFSYVSGSIYTFSGYFRAGPRTQVHLSLPVSAFGVLTQAVFNLSTGVIDLTVGSPLGAAIEFVGSGWYRCSLWKAATATAAGNAIVRLYSGGGTGYTGDGTSYIMAWGLQVEVGAEASTYKMTTTASVREFWGTSAYRCFNTWGTCGSKRDYTAGGRMRWRFVRNRPGLPDFSDFSVADDPATPPIPVAGLQISTSQAQINIAGVLEGKSPFGVHPSCTVTMPDFVWDDAWGDFYKAARGAGVKRMFWAVWTARNMFFGGMELVIYEGYVGDTLAAMRQRLYILDGIDGPDGTGAVTLRGVSPLMLAEAKRSLFPPAMTMTLVNDLTDVALTARVTTDLETNLSQTMGIGGSKMIIIGSEMINYSGYTTVSPGVFDLTLTARGVGNTVAAAAGVNTRVGRVGLFDDVETWKCGEYLLGNWTPVTPARINSALWAEEGDTYLPTFRSRTYVTTPTPVTDLMGEICQQGMFHTWYDEYVQLVQMQAVRPPKGAIFSLTGATEILADSAKLRREPESLLTRVFVYYAPRDPLKLGNGNEANYRNVSGQIEVTNEGPQAANGPRVLEIFARWVQTEAHAFQIISRVLMRYRDVPRFLSVHVSAKDQTLTIGDVCEAVTREIVETEGGISMQRWQVISWKQVVPGEVYFLDLQTYQLIGRFGFWMASGAPDYLAATDAQRAMGAWWSDADGLMSDGSPGYNWQ